MISVDKCSGEDCTCKLACTPVQIFIDSVNRGFIYASSGPPEQPGFGGLTMQQALQIQADTSYRRRRLHEYMWGETRE